MESKNNFSRFLKESIPGTIWAIGISSLLINMATAVVFSGSALYMKTVLGIAVSTIGTLEAIVEAIAYAIRIFSGILSDYMKRRKSLMLIGFILLTIAKPILAFSTNIIQIFTARTLDRLGNGIQASPREALVGDIAPKKSKGACYGLRHSLSVIGSTLGGLFGILVMKSTNNDFQLMFLLATIPAIFAVFVIIFFVREKRNNNIEENQQSNSKKFIRLSDLPKLGIKFWILMMTVGILMLGRFSEIFISLNACDNFGLNVAYGTAITVVYNLTSTLSGYPVGLLSDKINRTNLLLIGIIILFLSHTTIFLAGNLLTIFIGTFLWGIQIGITQSIISTLVSDYVPKELRGTGFGVYYLITSISTASASVIAGFLSQHNSGNESIAFLYGAITTTIAILIFLSTRKILEK